MLRQELKQLSFYSSLYDKIPENHILKRIEKAVDFSFINDMLKDSYCAGFGRPAKEPEMMMKLLFLQYLYSLSDVKVIDEANYNLAFLWFLGLNPEDKLPDASLLAKFRTQRLQETTLDDVIVEITRQCVQKSIIKSDGISIDTTHIEANTIKKVPERMMKHLAKKIFKGLEADLGEVPEFVNTKIPDYTQIEDHKEAKETMKSYLEEVISQSEIVSGEKTKEAINEAIEVLSDEKFMLQKGQRSLVDSDARVGSKSKTSRFFGYKTDFTMTTDERIITAVDVHSGEYTDGKEIANLIEKTIQSGFEINEFYGDKAYFRKDILNKLKDINCEAYVPVSACAYHINEELYSYNKDSDEWFCMMGNYTISKKTKKSTKRGKTEDIYEYVFEKSQCENCPHRDICIKKAQTKAKRLTVALHTSEFYEISQKQKQPEFLEKYKKRAAHEWKNGELKRFHGLARARGWGLFSVTRQAKLTAIAVNLKRIAAITGGFLTVFSPILRNISYFQIFFEKYHKISLNSRFQSRLEPTFSVVSDGSLELTNGTKHDIIISRVRQFGACNIVG